MYSKYNIIYLETSTLKIKEAYYLDSYKKKSSLEDENYPQFSSSKSEEISVWRTYGIYIVSSISLFLLFVLIICNYFCNKKTVIFLINVDFLPISGIHIILFKGGSSKKCSGGIVTLFYFLIILGMIISYIVNYLLKIDKIYSLQ